MVYDAIVVGAGPAGSLTALHLAKEGLKVLVLEAELFPRPKACGGGLQERATSHIPLDWRTVVRSQLSDITFTYQFGDRFTRSSRSTLVYGVLRSEFDEFLLNAAKNCGASVRHGVRAVRLARNGPSGVLLETSHGEVAGRFLIGADGANSVVANSLNSRQNYYWQAGMYAEIPLTLVQERVSTSIRIDWGLLPGGYAWIFPKNGSVNVGAGSLCSMGKMLRSYVGRLLAEEGLLKPGAAEQVRLRGHQLPTLTKRTQLSRWSVLLVGDAAGLVDPLTGDGISQACHSATLAAQAVMASAETRRFDLSEYEYLVRREIGRELNDSRKLLALTVAFPRIVYDVFKNSDGVWESFCKVLRGEASIRSLREKLLGPLRSAWFLIEPLLPRLEKYRISGATTESLFALGE